MQLNKCKKSKKNKQIISIKWRVRIENEIALIRVEKTKLKVQFIGVNEVSQISHKK
jgi:hypothetical protein